MNDVAGEILADLQKVRLPVESCYTLPPGCYTDEGWLKREQEQIFRRGWVSVGREDRWAGVGDYVALDLAGVPVIVLRDQQGGLRAFANSCRHRGMKLLDGEGQCQAITCPFHSWTYGLDGGLVAASRMETAEGFDLAEFGLVAFRLGVVDGFVFVCLDDTQVDLAEWLGDFSDVHYPWALEELVATRTREFEVQCNWKTFLEVFNDYYHVPFVHPDSLKGIYAEPDAVDVVMGEYTTQFGVTEGSAALMEGAKDQGLPGASRLKGRDLSGTRYSWVYPNMTFAACFDSLWMYEAYPLSVDHCRVVQTIGFPRASTERADFAEKAEAYYERIDIAIGEDLPVLEQQQIGLTSPYAKQGRFSVLEPSVGNFATWYADRMSVRHGRMDAKE